jgi:hypothetical protein
MKEEEEQEEEEEEKNSQVAPEPLTLVSVTTASLS